MQQFLSMIKGKLWQGYGSVEDEQWNLAPKKTASFVRGKKKKNTTVEEHTKLMAPC